jgi:DNA helicase-2/ATP-dependent DNA helicase PcrA
MQELIKMRDEYTVVPLLSEVLDKTGYVKALEDEDTVEARGRIENIRELVSAAVEFEESHGGQATLSEFLESVALVSETDNLDDGEGVTLMTLHSAKGLEFPVVFITGMEDGVFPITRAIEEPEDLEEERRLCYVGMTRAKELLYLTRAQSRILYGRTSNNPPSMFLDEIPGSLVEMMEGEKPAAAAAEVRKTGGDGAGDFRPGSRIQHRIWGMGTVIKAETRGDDTEVTIAFPGLGVKKVLASIAPIRALK